MSYSLFIILLLLIPSESLSGPTSAAKKSYDQAGQTFYKQLRALGPGPSPEQISLLRDQTLSPAQAGIILKSNQDLVDAEKNIRQTVYNSLQKAFPNTKLPPFILNPSFNSKKTTQEQTPMVKPKTLPAKKASEKSKLPETEDPAKEVLNGSNIPKEIEFSGKQSK